MTICTICGHRPHTCVESPSGEAGPNSQPALDSSGAAPPVCEHCWGSGTEPSPRTAPPPAGALHPLALELRRVGQWLANLLGYENMRTPFPGWNDALVAWNAAALAWEKAVIYTAAPPTLSAEERPTWCQHRWTCSYHRHDGEMHCRLPHGHEGQHVSQSHWQCTDGELPVPAARAPVTPTPEPATVEPCGDVHPHYPSRVCNKPKGHATGENVYDRPHFDGFASSWEPPAPEPARPPAVTREEFDVLVRWVKALVHGEGTHWHAQMDKDLAEARCDADRRGDEVMDADWAAAILKRNQLEREINESSAAPHQKRNMQHTLSKLWMFAAEAPMSFEAARVADEASKAADRQAGGGGS